jgi:protein-S-isoprenylcysteine O-methyltransferase Ste14
VDVLGMSKRSQVSNRLSDFHRQHDISYLDPQLPPATLRQALRHYLVSALIYGFMLLFFTINPWFRDLLRMEFHSFKGEIRGFKAIYLYVYGYGAYLLIAPLVFFIGRPRSLWASKNLLIVGYLARLARWLRRPASQREADAWRPSYAEKHAMMFFLIKTIYGPLMINSALLAYNSLPPLFQDLQLDHSALNVCDKGYMVIFSSVFLLDSVLFAVGYHTESGLLRNKLRYAETNPLHILVCIACYSPFNMPTGALFGPSNHDPYILFGGNVLHPLTWVLRVGAIFFLLVLISASLALFTKASNLTNRGIVDWGPYRYIRHPGYLGKNMFWLMTLIPAFFPNTADPQFWWPSYLAFCAATVWGFVGWGTIYFLRALTEERFLMRDPDYVAYCRKVKYRFIPGVY